MKNKLILVLLLCLFIVMPEREAFAGTGLFAYYKDKKETYTKNSQPELIGLSGTGIGADGTYPTRKGVILVTQSGSVGKVLGHAAIVYSASTVVESLPKGVVLGNNDWNLTKSNVAAVTVKNTTVSQDRTIANYCYGKIGARYNYNYYDMASRKLFYCSHLVWAGYKDVYGIDLNTSAYDTLTKKAIGPFEFVRESGKQIFPVYFKNWTKQDVTK
ncbi:MAG: hypothetical protein K6G26_12760 [Lachnospiraceae bacterium]|nr:hypothetical protein [Lachnospiraceae bacterium]